MKRALLVTFALFSFTPLLLPMSLKDQWSAVTILLALNVIVLIKCSHINNRVW